jgi:hypothetical protein
VPHAFGPGNAGGSQTNLATALNDVLQCSTAALRLMPRSEHSCSLALECRNYNERIVQMSGKARSKLRIDAAIRAAHRLGPVYTRDARAMAMGGAMVSTNSLRIGVGHMPDRW